MDECQHQTFAVSYWWLWTYCCQLESKQSTQWLITGTWSASVGRTWHQTAEPSQTQITFKSNYVNFDACLYTILCILYCCHCKHKQSKTSQLQNNTFEWWLMMLQPLEFKLVAFTFGWSCIFCISYTENLLVADLYIWHLMAFVTEQNATHNNNRRKS